MKFFKISDLHYGKYTLDSDKWLKLMTSYMYEWFIPTVKKHIKKDDKIIILGDIFDNRNSINLKVITAVVKLFEDLSKLGEVHAIVGNHDMYLMNNPEINSVCMIRNIPNVFIYEKPTVMTFANKDVVFMPWIHGKDNELEVISKYSGANLLLCHSDLNGCRTQLYPTRPHNRKILEIDDFKGFDRVFSGHIHIQQTINNFTFVGAPYHLDRNDIGNEKGIWVYDVKTGKELFIENDFSPQFKKIEIYDEAALKTLKEEDFNNDFIDLHISKTFLSSNPKLRLQVEKITNKWKINEVFYINDIIEEKKQTVKSTKPGSAPDKTIKQWSIDWIDDLQFNIDHDMFTEIELRDCMKEQVDKCYEILQINSK